MASPAAQPLAAPVLFAQRLADNEKSTREQAVRKLRKYLRARSRSGGFSDDELSKIWKGLFYCMWMQDKPLLQEDLANTISQLVHSFLNTESQLLFLQTFWQTMNREWNGIDRLRLDKFYTLCRMLLRESFQVLKKNKWEDSLVEPFLNLLTKEVLHTESHAPNGVKFHLIDIYLEELAKVGSEELQAEQNLKFIDPFCKIAAKTKDHQLMHAIARGIFEAIVDQSPFAIEELMKELKQSKGIREEEQTESEEEDDAVDSKTPLKQSKAESDEDLFSEDFDEEGGDANLDEDEPIESIGPVLQFDYSAVADRLFELSSKKFTPPQNRKRLYRLVKRFRDLAEGTFPQDDFPEDVSTDEDDDEFSQRWARKKHFRALKNKAEEKKAKEKDALGKVRSQEEGASPVPPKKKRKKRKAKDSHPLPHPNVAASDESSIAAVEPDQPNTGNQPEAGKKRVKKISQDTGAESTGDDVAINENNNSGSLSLHVSGPQGKKARSKKMRANCVEELAEILQNGLDSGISTSDGREDTLTCPTSKPKKKMKVSQASGNAVLPQAGERLVETKDEGETHASSVPKKGKVSQVNGKPLLAWAEESSMQAATDKDLTCAAKRPKKKGKCSEVNGNTILPLADESSTQATNDCAKSGLAPPRKLKLKVKRKRLQLAEASAGSPTTKKKRKIKEVLSMTDVNVAPVSSNKKSKRSVLDDDTFVPIVTNQLKIPKIENDFVKFGKTTPPKPLFVKKNKGSVSGLATQKLSRLLSSGIKKVTFGLSKNMTAEFKKTDKSILVSPVGAARIAFNPEQKPLHGVLKTPPLRTPLGPLSKMKFKKRAASLSAPAQNQATAFSTPPQKQGKAFATPPQKQGKAFATPPQKQCKAFATPPQKQGKAFSTPPQKQGKAFSTPPQKQGKAFSTPPQKQGAIFSTPTQRQTKSFSTASQKQVTTFSILSPKKAMVLSTPTQKRSIAADFF